LQIDDLVNIPSTENVMIPSHSLVKAKSDKQLTQRREIYILVGASGQNSLPQLRVFSHYLPFTSVFHS
jgi:hypothetical protein